MKNETQYTEDNIRSLDWKEHIRMRPGMYIGKLGDGSSNDDGIYILIKEVLDNSIDEFVMEIRFSCLQKIGRFKWCRYQSRKCTFYIF